MWDGPYYVVERPAFTARLLLDPDELNTVENVDCRVALPDGTEYALTLLTTGAIEAVLAVWRESGEACHGSFFWCSDLVIVPAPGIENVIQAIDGLVQCDDLPAVGTRVDDVD